ncbi:hypothetical protein P2G88_03815 [Aliiglaciecola sp. CAU 1673]|uniref:hypothetical protein n=1 Tax=Aliiglaciecola sp. CAU 1673 TaxID=3032595 RepID=UPI0023DA72BF|nr:hypothetical protein [Aliiglaciecola sp. CAU 1673]MDF2177371.1 hypothetical protein [Aliiglaciecola sp. CAU 1673]
MKLHSPSVSLLLSALVICSATAAKETTPVLEGPYLGQTPPGLTAKPFAPGIVTTQGFDDGGVFSNDMEAFYFIRKNSEKNKFETVIYKLKGNLWVETVSEEPRPFYPFFSPDGKTMHLGKGYRERTDAGWSEIKSLGAPFDDINIMSLSASLQGTFAIDERRPDDDGILRFSRLIDGKREAPIPFNQDINSGTRNAHPFIAPDESYVMWDGIKEGGFGDVDLYISFRQPDGAWGPAINMGDKVNTAAYEAGPKVTPDGKYLFFVRNMGSDKFEDVDIFWVDAQIIETLRPH